MQPQQLVLKRRKHEVAVKHNEMTGLPSRAVSVNDNNFNNNLNANNQCNNNGRARRMVCAGARIFSFMKTYNDLWEPLCGKENLLQSYENAKKHKLCNPRIQEFIEHAPFHLALLRHELRTKTYKPLPLKTFILRDPKTRLISVSHFRDRAIHHALVNSLQPIFEPRFIYDSYDSRKEKGTLKALDRFDDFKRKITKNGTQKIAMRFKKNNERKKIIRTRVCFQSRHLPLL